MNAINTPRRPVTILLADDSEDDRFMTRQALVESFVLNDLHEVEDGEELMEYLRREGRFSLPINSPRPDLILLDLNMPRKNGLEALKEIKADAFLKRIPVVILTTSDDEHDVLRSYDSGVSSFITKPVTFDGLVNVMKTFGKYWIEVVVTPRFDDE